MPDSDSSHTIDLDHPDAPPPARAPDPEVTPEAPGRYVVGEEIGRGGQARVLSTFDRHTGREVAWKEPTQGSHPSTGSTAVRRDRFLREARITAWLQHPNIVPVHELGRRDDGSLYYTMRRIRGETLAFRLKSAPDLAGRLRLLGAFWDACNAVAYAHDKGVIHRDLKPENVMVGRFGETVVLDWGLAKVRAEVDPVLAEEFAGSGNETIAGAAVGTPCYMSPEQADGQPADERSDVWGLGAVLFELLTGQPPFSGGNAWQVLAKVRDLPVPDPAILCPGAPAELVAVARQALDRDPACRYQSARELAEDVSAFMTGRRVRAHEYSSWELLRRFAVRNRAAVTAAAVVAATVLVALAGVSVAWRRAAEARDREHAQRLQAHHVLAEAHGLEADRLQAAGSSLAAAVFAAASLVENPANPRGPVHAPGFGTTHPGAARLLVQAASRLRQGQTGPFAALVAAWPGADSLMDVAFSPDGTRVAAASYGGGVVVRDVATGEVVLDPAGDARITYALAFFPDGRRLVTAGREPALQVWDLATGEALLEVAEVSGRAASAVAVSPDGALLATLAGEGGDLRLTDANTGEAVRTFPAHPDRITALAFSPGGDLLASAGTDGTVRLWHPATGRAAGTFPHPDARVYALGFTHDGRHLLTAATDHAVRAWDLASGIPERLAEHAEDRFYHVTLSADGARIVTGGATGAVRVWRRADGRQEGVVTHHRDAISAVALSPDGGLLASGGYDGVLRLWRLRPQDAAAFLPVAGGVGAVAWTPDGLLLAAGADGVVRAWSGGEPAWAVPTAPSLAALAVSGSGHRLAVGGEAQRVEIRDGGDGGLLGTLEGHRGSIWDVDFSSTGARAATVSGDGTARLWDVDAGGETARMEDAKVHLEAVAFSPDDTLVAGVGGDATVFLWDVPGGRLVRTLTGHDDWITGVAWLPGPPGEPRQLVTGSRDGTARLWDADRGELLRRFEGHGAPIECIAVHPGRRRLASLDRDRHLLVWDLDTGAPTLWLLDVSSGDDLAFSPDGTTLAVAGGAGVTLVPAGDATLPADPGATLAEASRTAGLALQGFSLVDPAALPAAGE